jgi:hypothetical protein
MREDRNVAPDVPLSDGIALPYDRTSPSHFCPWQSIGLDGRLALIALCQAGVGVGVGRVRSDKQTIQRV